MVHSSFLKAISTLTIIFVMMGCAKTITVVELGRYTIMEGLIKDADLIFVHGYGGSSCSWSLVDREIQKFSSPAYLDLVGFGKHQPPAGFDFSIESQAKQLAAQFSNYDHENSIIVAHSMGAAVILVAMLDYGFEPSQVILVDPLVYQQPLPFFIKGQILPIVSSLTSKFLSPSFQVDFVLNAIYFDRKNVDQKIRNCYIKEFETPFHRDTLISTARKLASFNAKPYVSRYGDLQTEFHIIWGKNDPLISSNLLPRLKDDLSATSSHVIENCGHAPHEECPEKFVRTLQKILD